jgi:hypothetical protein
MPILRNVIIVKLVSYKDFNGFFFTNYCNQILFLNLYLFNFFSDDPNCIVTCKECVPNLSFCNGNYLFVNIIYITDIQ